MAINTSTAAANASVFVSPLWGDDDFVSWALRVAFRLRNLPPNAPVHLTRRALFSEGTPSAAWAEEIKFTLTLSRTGR